MSNAQETPLVLPTVHLGGTSRDNLLLDRKNLCRRLEDALAALRIMPPHARDYHGDHDRYTQAVLQHTRRKGMLSDLLAEIGAEIRAIADAE